MNARDIAVSLSIHGALLGAAAGLYRPPPPPDSGPVPIFFELVEESSAEPVPPPEAGPVPIKEVPVPVSEMVPVPAPEVGTGTPPAVGTVPENVGTGTIAEVGTVPENVGTGTIAEVGTVPAEEGPVPMENVGTGPIDEVKMFEKNEGFEYISGVIEKAKVVADPVALNRIVPVYPRSARRRGHEGTVTVEILVEADGAVSGAELVASSGHGELDDAALGAARSARFAPAIEDGECVSGRLRLTFDFRLE